MLKLCVCVCVLVLGLTAVLNTLKSCRCLDTNQNFANINVSGLQVHKQQHVLVVSVHLEVKVSLSSISWYLFDLLIGPLSFPFISVCDPIKGTKWALC